MKILVTGGRHYADREHVFDALDRLKPTEIAQGGATGADRLARIYARQNNVPCRTWRADWKQYGRAAGPIRNEQMLLDFDPDLVLAFPGGTGTAGMVKIAKRARTPVEDLR